MKRRAVRKDERAQNEHEAKNSLNVVSLLSVVNVRAKKEREMGAWKQVPSRTMLAHESTHHVHQTLSAVTERSRSIPQTLLTSCASSSFSEDELM
jgi:hypothetical protein